MFKKVIKNYIKYSTLYKQIKYLIAGLKPLEIECPFNRTLRMYFNPGTKKAIQNSTAYLSRQNPITQLIAELLLANNKNFVFLDVGANHGIHLLRIAYSFPEIKCIGFEPNQDLVKLMKKTINLNKITNVKIFNCGLGDNEESLYLNYNPFSTGHASFFNLSHGLNYKSKLCRITTLDTFLSSSTLLSKEQKFIIKVDIEGFEKNFLIGAVKTLKEKTVAIVFEHDKKAKEAGTNFEEINDLLKQAEMECHISNSIPNNIIAINQQFIPDIYSKTNFDLIPIDSSSKVID